MAPGNLSFPHTRIPILPIGIPLQARTSPHNVRPCLRRRHVRQRRDSGLGAVGRDHHVGGPANGVPQRKLLPLGSD
jgi:hypothetical protein